MKSEVIDSELYKITDDEIKVLKEKISNLKIKHLLAFYNAREIRKALSKGI